MANGTVKLTLTSVFDEKGTKAAEKAMRDFEKQAAIMAGDTSLATSFAEKSIAAEQMAAKFTKAADAIGAIGSKLSLFVTAPLLAVGAAATSTAIDFDTAMSQLGGALDMPIDQLGDLKQLAIDTGNSTIYSAEDAAEAMTELAKGGLTEADIKGGALASTMQLAAAGSLDLSTAANTVVQEMGAFHLTADDTSIAVNALAGAANASSSDVSDLTEGLSQAAAQASNAGWTIQDTTAVLAAFADNGIKGSDAGTSLKTCLQRLAAPTDDAADAISALGINVRDGNGNMLDAAGVAQELQNKLGGLSSAQRDAALQTIFGSDASRAALVLMNEGSAGIENYTAATNDQSAAQRMADAQMGDSQRALENMSGSLETAGIQLGEAIAPSVVDVANKVGDLADKFSGLDAGQQKTIVTMLAVAAATGPVVSIIGKGVGTIGNMVGAYGKLSAKLAEVSAKSSGAATAIKGLESATKIAIAALAVFTIDEIYAGLSGITGAAENAQTALDSAAGSVTSLATMASTATPLVGDLSGTVTETGQTIAELSTVIDSNEAAITAIIQSRLSEQQTLRQEDLDNIAAYNAAIAEAEKAKLNSYMSSLDSVSTMVEAEGTITRDAAATYLSTANETYSQAQTDLESWYQGRLTTINNEYSTEDSRHSQAYQDELAAAKAYYDQSQSDLNTHYDSVKSTVVNSMDQVSTDDVSAWNDMQYAQDEWHTSSMNGITQVANWATQWTATYRDNVSDYKSALADVTNQTTSDYLQQTLTIADSTGQISQSNLDMVNTILNNMYDLPDGFDDAATKAMRSLAAGMDDQLGIDVANSTADQIIEAYRKNIDKAKTTGADYVAGIESGLDTNHDGVISAAERLATTTKDSYGNKLGIHSPSTVGIEQGGYYAAGVAQGIDDGQPQVSASSTSLASAVMSVVSGGLSGSSGLGSVFSSDLSGGMDSGSGWVVGSAATMAQDAASAITDKFSEARDWGSDLMSGLADGIWSCMGWAADAAEAAAEKIASYLHFSRPDEGPLRDYETWMPDMVAGLSDTLSASAPHLVAQSAELAQQMRDQMIVEDVRAGYSYGGQGYVAADVRNSGGTSTTIININATIDASSLADVKTVEDMLDRINRNNANALVRAARTA
jgi:TP901 family phage tail tape measure protein